MESIENENVEKVEEIQNKGNGENNITNDDKMEVAENNAQKLNKIKLPKRKYAIIHGYNGHHFSGNQK
jgi:hypothetical protein